MSFLIVLPLRNPAASVSLPIKWVEYNPHGKVGTEVAKCIEKGPGSLHPFFSEWTWEQSSVQMTGEESPAALLGDWAGN